MTLGTLWRRVRGLLGNSVVWGVAWALAGLVVGGVFWLTGASFFSLTGPRWLWVWAEVGAVTGAVSRGAFSLAVITLERRGDFRAITPFRFGVLGAVAAGLVMAIGSAPLLVGLTGGAIGFLCGSGSVIVARRALPAPRSTVSVLPPAV
jgi:hypothetical protein